MRKSCPLFLVALVSALALALAAPSSAQAQDVRLGQDVVPTFQSVDLRLDAGTPGYTGSVHVELTARKETNVFRFHAEAMELQTVVLRSGDRIIDLTHETDEKGVVTVTTGEILKPGDYTLDITFADDFNTDAVSLYRMEMDGVGYAFTQFEADDGREAFPMWDEPGFKIPYQLTLTVPEDHLAVTNTPVESESVESGWRTTVFQKTKPLPSYLLAIATGPLETVDMPGLGVPGRIVTVKGQTHLARTAIAMAPPILKALEEYFGSKYPYEKLDFIAIPEYWPGAMENPGAITFADRILLVDPKTVSIGQKRGLSRIVAHELAHMWFGDLVTMEWWDDLWLNESFADWMGDKIADQVFPRNKQALSTARDGQRIMGSDARPSTVAIRRPVLYTDSLLEDIGLAYSKGKAVLAMFEQWMGPKDFRKGVLSYINANAWGNAQAGDLWRELDKASGKKISESLATFIDQPGIPFIGVEVLDHGKIHISQRRFHNYGVDIEPVTWRVPVALKYSAKGKIKTKTILLTKKSETVDLGGDIEWVFPHVNGVGYYRWNLSPKMLESLAQNAVLQLSPRERIVLLGNAGALLQAGEINGANYLGILNAFAQDPEPLVMTSMLDGLGGVEAAFVPEELKDVFAIYVKRTLGPALDRYGLEISEGEDETVSLIRPRLVRWMGEAKDAKTLEFAREQAKIYMEGSTVSDPALIGVSLNLMARDGDMELYETFKTKMENATVPTDRGRYLGALGSFQDPAIQMASMEYALSDKLRPNEMFSLTGGRGTEAGQNRSFRWMMDNYDAIVGRIPPVFASFMPFFAGGCSGERLGKAKVFFADPAHQASSTEKQLAKVTDQVNDCLTLREREGAAVARYLKELAKSDTSGGNTRD